MHAGLELQALSAMPGQWKLLGPHPNAVSIILTTGQVKVELLFEILMEKSHEVW